MRAVIPLQRHTIALVATFIGIAAFQVTGAPFGLIAPLAAAFLYANGATAGLVNGLLAIAAGLLAAAAGLAGAGDAALGWAAFCGVAFSVGMAVAAASRQVEERAIQATEIIEAMPAHPSSTDPEGRFTSVTPDTLALLGATLDGDGRITGWHGTTMDIYDQKRSEAALVARERELSQLVNLVPSHLWRLDPDGEPIFFNRRMADFLGFDVAAIATSGTSRLEALADGVHPDDRAAFRQALGSSLLFGESFTLRYRLRRSDGAFRWMSSRAEPLRDDSARIVQWYGLCVDIDDQVRVENALRQSERQLQQLIDTVPVQIWCTTPAGQPDYVNRAMAAYLGLQLEDFEAEGGLPDAIATIVHPDDRERLHAALTRSFATGEPFELKFRNLRWDGAWRWMEGRANPLHDESGRIIQWYGANVDIDDLVRVEDEVRERERELSQLVDMVPGLLWRLAPDGEPVFFNRRMVEYFDTPAADFTAERGGLMASVAAHVHPDDLPNVTDILTRSLASGEGFSLTHRLRRADGVYRWMSVRAEPLRNESGAILQWYGICHDVEEQLLNEEALRERERFLWQLVETLPAMVVLADPDGEPVYRSEQLRSYLGFGVEPLDGAGQSRLDRTLDTAIHPDDLAAVREHYAHSRATGEPYRHKHRLRRFDGEYRWVDTRAAPMRDHDGAIVHWNLICLDIEGEVQAQEALRLAQERLARASQAASLAELSASIAHEVNQPLAAVVANSQACHRWLSATPPNLERAKITAERITRDANAAADVVGRIRALFRQSTETRTSASLGGVLAEARELMAEEAIRRQTRLVLEVADDLPPILMDRVQIQQVLVNLIRNGMDAMATVACDRVVRIAARRTGDAVRIEVADRGIGMEAPDRIFEPFFTTKDKGMGMGLAICRSIVESHGGRLWAESGQPQGATFVFTLPAAAEPVA